MVTTPRGAVDRKRARRRHRNSKAAQRKRERDAKLRAAGDADAIARHAVERARDAERHRVAWRADSAAIADGDQAAKARRDARNAQKRRWRKDDADAADDGDEMARAAIATTHSNQAPPHAQKLDCISTPRDSECGRRSDALLDRDRLLAMVTTRSAGAGGGAAGRKAEKRREQKRLTMQRHREREAKKRDDGDAEAIAKRAAQLEYDAEYHSKAWHEDSVAIAEGDPAATARRGERYARERHARDDELNAADEGNELAQAAIEARRAAEAARLREHRQLER
eukprot:CAMPEP_0198675004 /NCGR_PEP_ID=MMETSP1467-20131203/98200_1 /TAXON_ID=1462469 /ORGANISM="unid. sp., Strain CCMP2135" /LENGTH=281 /DNA_ID=CAMNT_0044411905 /DNA_START=29 /DNA_END=875 /DNA_ORIENTATION=-